MNKMLSKLMVIYLCGNVAFTSENTSQPLAEFNGEGEVKADADLILLTLSITSDCQATPADAQGATDEVVARIDKYLQGLKDPKDAHFKILVDGGFTSPYSRYFKDRNICDKTFQKNTNVTLKIGNSKNFDQIFGKLQTHILSNFEQMGFEGNEVARTYVSIGTPEPQLTPEHMRELSREALDLAFKDAKANFTAAIKSCEPHRWKVMSIKEQGVYPQPVMYKTARYHAAPAAAMASDTIAPVRFDRIKVQKNLAVGFSFEGSLCFDR